MSALDLGSSVASAAEDKGLHRRSDLAEQGWTFWERRTVNIHRVVGLLRASTSARDVNELDAQLRLALARNFKRAWWRGIAYGVVANVGALTFTPEDLKVLVDGYENPKGTMQWVILLSGDADARHATGVHTWIEGYLSPVYRAVLHALNERGYQVASARKEKDGLMRALTRVADARAIPGTRRVAFPEFRDPFRPS
jgi:hypothetical protein